MLDVPLCFIHAKDPLTLCAHVYKTLLKAMIHLATGARSKRQANSKQNTQGAFLTGRTAAAAATDGHKPGVEMKKQNPKKPRTHVKAPKAGGDILRPTSPWAPLARTECGAQGSTFAASSLPLRPLSTDSCFLTKPTLLQADPVIMRPCPEPQATKGAMSTARS